MATPQICQIDECTRRVWSLGRCRRHDNAFRQPSKQEKQAKRREYYLICAHQQAIRNGIGSYKDMPVFAAWDTAEGGSPLMAEKWILENLGKRPNDGQRWDLHIVDRSLGLVPGNLRWLPRNKHKQEELIAKLMLENQNLRRIIGLEIPA